MKTNIAGGIFHLTKCVLFLLIILALSCTSTSYMRLEGDDFNKNLPGRWEGRWNWGRMSGKQHIKISKIDGNKVQLTGYSQGGTESPDTNEVYGRIENSTLILTWPVPAGGCEEKYKMIRDDSNNLMLDGYFTCKEIHGKGEVNMKKIE